MSRPARFRRSRFQVSCQVMYRIQDGYGFEVATIYFFLLIPALPPLFCRPTHILGRSMYCR